MDDGKRLKFSLNTPKLLEEKKIGGGGERRKKGSGHISMNFKLTSCRACTTLASPKSPKKFVTKRQYFTVDRRKLLKKNHG